MPVQRTYFVGEHSGVSDVPDHLDDDSRRLDPRSLFELPACSTALERAPLR